MDFHQGVKVEVICKGNTLPSFEDPDVEDGYPERSARRYVEASTGANFRLKISLAEAYAMHSCDFVKATAEFDGNNRWATYISKEEVASGIRSAHFHYVTVFSPTTNFWEESKLCFGKLATSMLAYGATSSCD